MAPKRITLVKDRIQKLSRVLKVQEQLKRQAELKLSDLRREALELQSVQETLIQTMNDHETLHGLFVDMTAKRLQVMAGQATQIEAAAAVQQKVVFEAAMQAKRVEKVLSVLKDEKRRTDEKKDLLAVVEAISRSSDASFP